MDKQKNTKEYQSLKRTIAGLLKDFEKNKEWADISNWLYRLQENINDKRFSELPQQITLAKRLAQCLNPTLPAGVHGTALKVYQTILLNFSARTELLPLMSIGLFPFFECSNLQLKFELIKIYEEHFTSDHECLQLMVSLLNALLAGLNENNEQLAKKIYALCAKVANCYGKVWVDGAVWVNILKSPKTRLAGFKYFMKTFKDRDREKGKQEGGERKEMLLRDGSVGKNQSQQSESQMLDTLLGFQERCDDNASRFPNFSTLVVNALCACLDTASDPLVKRSALDLLSNYLKMTNRQIMGKQEAVVLVQAMLQLLKGKEYSLTNRVYKYLFDQPDAEGFFMVDNESKKYQLQVLKQALDSLLIVGERRQGSCPDEGVLTIIYTLISDHKAMPSILVSHLAYQILRYLREFYLSNAIKLKTVKAITVQFYHAIVFKHRVLFVTSILDKMAAICSEVQEDNNRQTVGQIVEGEEIDLETKIKQKKRSHLLQEQYGQIVQILKFYFNRLEKMSSNLFEKNPSRKNSENSLGKSVHQDRDKVNSKAQDKDKEQENDKKSQEKAQQQQTDLSQLEKYLFIRKTVIQRLIVFLQEVNPKESIFVQVLDLLNKIHREYLRHNVSQQPDMASKEIVVIDRMIDLMNRKAVKGVYGRLITLHPSPSKDILLPFINESSLAIVCISLLLNADKVVYEGDERKRSMFKSVPDSELDLCRSRSLSAGNQTGLNYHEQENLFSSIFKLLNCHLFEDKAIEFISLFRNTYQETFDRLINEVDPSEWLIYWRKMNGDVAGGIIRMITNVTSSNSYKKHLSCKWIEESESIVSKIVDPVYDIIRSDMCSNQEAIAELPKAPRRSSYDLVVTSQPYLQIFSLLKSIFKVGKTKFRRFFFLQRHKYIEPLFNYTFWCCTKGSKVKSSAIDIISFVLMQADSVEEHLDVINTAIGRTISFLDQTIDAKKQIAHEQQPECLGQIDTYSHKKNKEVELDNFEIELLQLLSSFCQSINDIATKKKKNEDIIALLKSTKLFEIILKGLVMSDVSYIKKLYMDFSKELCEMVTRLQVDKSNASSFVNQVLQKLFFMLRNQDITMLQEIIKGKKTSQSTSTKRIRKMSSMFNQRDQLIERHQQKESVYNETLSKNDLNVQSKYSEVIQLWNSVKFYVRFSLANDISSLPIINLLSLLLQSFPFSYLKYSQFSEAEGSRNSLANFERLQDEIKNMTSLKKQVLQIFNMIWEKFANDIIDYLLQKSDPRILIHCSVDPTQVILTILRSHKLKDITRYYRSKKFNLPRGTLHYNIETLGKENQLNYFIYLYMLYCNLALARGKKVLTFYESFVELLRNLQSTTHVQSKLWILEIMALYAERIMANKDLHMQGVNKVRADMQQQAKELLDELVCVIVKSKNFTHKLQIRTGLFTLFSKEQEQTSLFDFVKIFPPTVFEMYEKFREKSKNKRYLPLHHKKTESVEEIQILPINNECLIIEDFLDSFLFSKHLNRSEREYIDYTSLCCLKTLIKIGNRLLINLYEKDLSKIGLIKEILLAVLPIYEEKDNENQHFLQLIAEYIHTLLDSTFLRGEVLRTMRRQIVEVSLGNYFYKCNQKTLAHWRAIIDYCTQGYDLLGQLLSKEGLFEGIFTKKAEATRLKIKSFERICFIIYAGRVDKYDNKLRTVLESLNEVMKEENPSPALLILILFCIRILFMRLSPVSLNKLFRSVWPGLMTLLIQIFRREKSGKNMNLLLAALKVIELIHALELEEFHMHKWMFVFDYFGVRIDPVGEECIRKQPETLSPFDFKPFLTNLLPSHRFMCTFLPQPSHTQQSATAILRRRIIVKESKVDSDEQLNTTAYNLLQYIMDLNQQRAQVCKDEIENLIQEDFISLDEYIFQIQ